MQRSLQLQIRRKNMISVKEAAELLHVSQKTVYRWIDEGKLPFKRLGKQYYIERADVSQLLTEEEQILPSLPDSGTDFDTPLSEMLRQAGIFYDIPGSTIQEVFHNSLSQIHGIDKQQMEPIIRMFLTREELASTGIGQGIAIPHARGSLVGYVSQPLLALSFLQEPLDFGALDGKPVQILFLLVSPNVQTHLRILAKLSFVLQDEQCKAAILRQSSAETILKVLAETEGKLRNGHWKGI
jgi:PTS system nitrogen regulatory IIA component